MWQAKWCTVSAVHAAFATKAKYAQEAGAEGLILVNNLGGGLCGYSG